MPKVPKRKNRKIPEGFEEIEPTIKEYERKMREVESENNEKRRAVESAWGVMQVHHQKSRYIFDLFYKRKVISKEVFDYCVSMGYADKHLMDKWNKPGYHNLCCIRCIQTKENTFGTVCICRAPREKMDDSVSFHCEHCGCRGCWG